MAPVPGASPLKVLPSGLAATPAMQMRPATRRGESAPNVESGHFAIPAASDKEREHCRPASGVFLPHGSGTLGDRSESVVWRDSQQPVYRAVGARSECRFRPMDARATSEPGRAVASRPVRARALPRWGRLLRRGSVTSPPSAERSARLGIRNPVVSPVATGVWPAVRDGTDTTCSTCTSPKCC
jgi:hypothetical protein